MERRDVVGHVPAAGRGNRIAPLPCSKEIYPIGFRRDGPNGEPRARAASHHLFDKMQRAGIETAYIVLRNGKWDIPAYFGDGQIVGMRLAYLVIEESQGPPDTLDRAFAFVRGKHVAFGFPDILFGPDDVFTRLMATSGNPDVVLGLFPAHDCRAMDMVDVDPQGLVRSMVLKPPSTHRRYTWLCAVWNPVFTEFMHDFVESELASRPNDVAAHRAKDAQGDLPVGAVMAAAVDKGLTVMGVVFPEHSYIDIGTPSDLVRAVAAANRGE